MTDKDQLEIQAKAIRERLLFKKYLKTNEQLNIKFTPYNGKDQFDATYIQLLNPQTNTIEFKKVLVEIKVREMTHRGLGGFIIEKKKYDYLMSKADKYDQILYINFFYDGYLIWDLKALPTPTFYTKQLPRNNQTSNTIEKEIAMLDLLQTKKKERAHINLIDYLKKSHEILKRIKK